MFRYVQQDTVKPLFGQHLNANRFELGYASLVVQ